VSTVHIAAIPVDGRPVVRAQVQKLVASAGSALHMPDVAQLGHFRTPADRSALAAWLEAQAPQVDGFVLSLDMLAYGGLVPSRFIDDSLDQLSAYLAPLAKLKARFPNKPIFAFAATMRMSNNNVNEEEKTYWSDFGELIWRWSFLSDRSTQTGNADDRAAATEAEQAIPEAIRLDYLATRARNFALTEQALALVAQGVIDRLVLPQDDTAEFGFNIAERRQLEQQVAARGLQDRVAIYAGADEVMHTLCARMVAQLAGLPTLSFFIHCSDPAHIGRLRALYEDRPVLDAVACQVAAAGASLAPSAEQADVILAVHTSGTAQGDWAMQKPLPDPQALTADWLAQLAQWHTAGKPLAVADLAYANGGDPAMLGALAGALPLNALAAYSGWNTASNSLGSLVAQCVLAQGNYHADANREVLALRLLEDLMYQAVLRQAVRLGASESALDASALRQRVASVYISHANAWARGHALGWQVSDIALPWNRSFEIDLQLTPAGAQP
jgi:hypothetical protein